MTQDTNIDDYYSHLSSQEKKEGGEQKAALKLKIKVKPKEAEEAPTALNVQEKQEVQEKHEENKPKIIIKKQPNIISFEPKKDMPKAEAPKPAPAPTHTPSPAPAPAPTHTPSYQSSQKFDKQQFRKHQPPIITFEPKKDIPAPKAEEKVNEDKMVTSEPAVSIDSESLQRFSNNKKRSFFDKKPEIQGEKKFPTPAAAPREDFSFDKKFKFKKSLKTKGILEDDDNTFRRAKKSYNIERREKIIDDLKQTLADKSGQEVALPDFLTVKEFSEKIGIPFSKIIGEFLKNGMMATLNTRVDFDTCFIIAEIFNIKVVKEQNNEISLTSVMEGNLVDLLKNDDPSKKTDRAPIISIMGHVDHGKTSILDYIRKTSVASGEAGGITQKIGAYQIEKNGKKITFLDTPGHEAFSIMRARGAKLTDIAIIVVAADEGMKPQTLESINHAKEAGVPIIVAVNKMDKPGANLDFVKGQLAEQGLQPEDWGGQTIVVPVSAHTGLGIETLTEMILLVAEMQELKADPARPAIATVIESHLDNKLGPLATVLVNSGTLRKGDAVVCASSSGRLKFLKDYKGKNIDEAGPSTPVLISGLSHVVEGGDILQAVHDIETAKHKAHEFQLMRSSKSLNQFEGASLELLLNRLKTGNLKQLKLVVKTDSNGSLEALKDALNKLSTQDTKIHIIHSGVGDMNDSDVIMAGTSQAILVGYNVGIVGNAKNTLQNSKIEVINKKVIYHILEKIESIITGMIDIKHEDVDLGEAKVKAIFFTSKDRMVVGCELKEGKVENRAKIRIIRDGKKVGNGEVASLKSGVVDVQEIFEGEFGIAFKGDVKLEVGDTLELFKVVQRK